MTDNKIDGIVEELKSEEERLKKELADLKKREQELLKSLKTVQSGLAGMAGKTTRKRPATKKTASQEAPARAAEEEQQSEVELEAFP